TDSKSLAPFGGLGDFPFPPFTQQNISAILAWQNVSFALPAYQPFFFRRFPLHQDDTLKNNI
ncbi:MAG: hypothetical protein ABUK20_14150, partial [Anaerolineales bacterium]